LESNPEEGVGNCFVPVTRVRKGSPLKGDQLSCW
jgi:hypothetical protein